MSKDENILVNRIDNLLNLQTIKDLEFEVKICRNRIKLLEDKLILNGVNRSLQIENDLVFLARIDFDKIDGEKPDWKKYYDQWLTDNYLK